MKVIKICPLFLLTLYITVFSSNVKSQNIKTNYIDRIGCGTDYCNLHIGMINYGPEELLTIDVSLTDGTHPLLKDSFVVKRGINQYKTRLELNDSMALKYADSNGSGHLWVEIKKKNGTLVHKSEEEFFIDKKTASIEVSKKNIGISLAENEQHLLVLILAPPQKKDTGAIYTDSIYMELKSDTTLNALDLISDLFSDRQIDISLLKDGRLLMKDTAYYHMGKFYSEPKPLMNETDSNQTDSDSSKTFPIQQRNGEFSISNYSYSASPHFDDGSQFPNTIMRLTNSMDVFSLPIRIEAYYSSSDRVHSAFRDYFNVSLDGHALRNRKINELLEAEKEKIANINTEIEADKKLKTKLSSIKEVLIEHPDYKINIDSLVQSESDQISKPNIPGSLQLNSQFPSDSLSVPDRPSLGSDSIKTLQGSNPIQKLDAYIKKLDKTIEAKESLKNKLLSEPEMADPNRFDEKSLYQLGDNNFEKILLRFNNLEAGNFYEYAGEYSIRDVEIKGLNSSFQLGPSLGMSFLTGKINDILFGSDVYSTSKKNVTSIGLEHSTKNFTSGLRFTSFSEKDKEIARSNSVIYSGFLGGHLFSFMQFEAELNFNPEETRTKMSGPSPILNNSANSIKLTATPFKRINIFAKYDYIGNRYQSDGVYFMQNNMEIYDIGTDIGLFKNKIKTKVAYRYQKRHMDDKTVKNDNRKWLFELRSNWNRLPNIHIIHSPATMELANQLDTSLIKLDVNSFVTIYRLYYLKKVKKTQITAMVMYNSISNSYGEYKIEQNSTMSSFYLIRESRAYSFNLSHFGFYDRIRYVSVSAQEPIFDKHLIKLQVLRYFNNIEEWSTTMPEYLIRGSMEFTIKKNYTVGIGSILTTYENHEPEMGLTLEGRVRW